MGLVAVLLGGVYPAIVQRFSVEPSESSKEREYIGRNIEATRRSGSRTSERVVPGGLLVGPRASRTTRTSCGTSALWEPAQLVRVVPADPGGRRFYQINDVDVDRYEVDGDLTEVELASRELDTAGAPVLVGVDPPSHGHGGGVADQRAGGGRRPLFYSRDVPVDVDDTFPDDLAQPNIYVGEDLGGYVVVDTDRQEVDYQDAEGRTQFTEYDGEDGVNIGRSGTRWRSPCASATSTP